MVKVSVIIPVFNVEKYINECVDSVINQTLTDIEIICVNDGSTDNSLNLLKQIPDPRIKIISQENKGLAAARNEGMKHAKGEYITFLDADDFLNYSALEKLFNAAHKFSLDMVITKIINFQDGTYEKFTDSYFDMDFLRDSCKNKVFNYKDVYSQVLNISVTSTGKLFKREFIKEIKFKENLIFEDTPFFIEAIFKADRVYFHDEYLYNRRIRKDSIISSSFSKFSDIIEIYNIIYGLLRQLGVYEDFKDKIFKKKFTNIYTRFSEVPDEYKDDFFMRIKKDFTNHFFVLKKDDDFKRFNKRAKHILYSGIHSKSYQEFELSVKLYDQENKNKKVKKEVTVLKNRNEKIMSLVNRFVRRMS